jgi:four helix bundle protein
MSMKFEDLDTWKDARTLVNEVYVITRDGSLAKDFGLRDQIQRAAVSVMTNIAEGFERTGGPEKLHFYNIARASCGEVRSLLYVVEDNHAAASEKAIQLRERAIHVGKLLSGLIASTQRRNLGKNAGLILALAIPTIYTFSYWLA